MKIATLSALVIASSAFAQELPTTGAIDSRLGKLARPRLPVGRDREEALRRPRLPARLPGVPLGAPVHGDDRVAAAAADPARQGWFTYFRLYGPTQPYFDKTWARDQQLARL
jgi:hypothetical protein